MAVDGVVSRGWWLKWRSLALGHDLGRRLGVHHVVEVGLELVVQVLGRMGEQVARPTSG